MTAAHHTLQDIDFAAAPGDESASLLLRDGHSSSGDFAPKVPAAALASINGVETSLWNDDDFESDIRAEEAEAFELAIAEAQLAATEDKLDAMWREPQWWTSHWFGDVYSNPNDPRFFVPNRNKVKGHRYVKNMSFNNAAADALKKLLAADEKLVKVLQKRNENLARERNGGKKVTHEVRVAWLARRGSEYCRKRWLEVDSQLRRHEHTMDQIAADPANWHQFNNFLFSGAVYCAVDDYRFRIQKDGKSFYNRQIGQSAESFRAQRLRRENERLTKEKKELEAAINALMAKQP